MENLTSPIQSLPQSEVPKKPPKTIWLVAIGLGVFLVIVVGTWVATTMLLTKSNPGNDKTAEKPPVSELFDAMLRTAAAKTTTRLTYAQLDYEDRSAFAANDPEEETYSVSELDLSTTDYRALFATTHGGVTYFEAMRCLDGKTLRSVNQPPLLGYKIIELAQKAFEQPFTHDMTASRGDDCKLTNPRHTARITDGIIPVGLTDEQINKWISALHQASRVTVSDDGTTTYQHKKVHKIHVATDGFAGASIFTSLLGEATGLELVTPSFEPGKDAYRLEEMAISSDIDGFYLVDEQSKLPVYSQFTTSRLVKDPEDPEFKNGKVLKYAYNYPVTVTLGQNSGLTIATWQK